MCPQHVFLQTLGSDKSFIAKGTHVGLLASMQSLVHPQLVHFLERLFADRTGIRAVVGVRTQVILQPAKNWELFPADVADVAQVVGRGMHATHVDVQVVSPGETFAANFALVGFGLTAFVQRHVLLE